MRPYELVIHAMFALRFSFKTRTSSRISPISLAREYQAVLSMNARSAHTVSLKSPMISVISQVLPFSAKWGRKHRYSVVFQMLLERGGRQIVQEILEGLLSSYIPRRGILIGRF